MRARAGAAIVGLAVMLAIAERVGAQTSRGDGSQTGDGSTPFTGLAQAPEANLFLGAATTSIPIEVPPGRKNIIPQLALSYSSNAGPSPYGYGWDLPLPHVQHATKRGIAACDDASFDDFVLSLPGGTAIECHREATGLCKPKVESSFVKIVWDPPTNVWRAWDKSGTRYTFGEDHRVSTKVGDLLFDRPARTGSATNLDQSFEYTHGIGCDYTFSWALTTVDEPSGNYLSIRYHAQHADAVRSHPTDGAVYFIGSYLYPISIQYGGNGPLPHMYEVRFEWQPRSAYGGDSPINSIGGFPATVSQRLAYIRVLYRGQPIRSYEFQYVPDRVGRQTFLRSVTLLDGFGNYLARADGLPAATVFQYHDKRAGFAAVAQRPPAIPFRTPPTGDSTHSGVLRWTDLDDGTRRDVLDMNGDGLPDLVDAWPVHRQHDGCPTGGAPAYWDVYLGSVNGFAASALHWAVPQDGLMCDVRRSSPTSTSMATVDLTGDGIPDFVDARTSPWTVYPGGYSPATGWGFGSAIAWDVPVGADPYPAKIQVIDTGVVIGNSGSNNDWHGSAVRQDLIDINGDGLLDLVQTPGGNDPVSPAPVTWSVWLNTGQGFQPAKFRGAFQSLGFLSSDGGQVGLVYGTFDVNGDGLPDQVMSQHARANSQYSGGWWVCLNSGYGTDLCSQWNVPQFGYWRNIRRVLDSEQQTANRDFFDINGDGLPDIVDTAGANTSGNWRVVLNQGAGFDQTIIDWPAPFPFVRQGSPGAGQTLQDTFDIDSDGMPDFVDFTGDPVQVFHSLDGAWTANGAVVQADPSGIRQDFLEAVENGIGGTTFLEYRPSTQWDNTGGDGRADLPFTIWTVTGIRRTDGMCTNGNAGCTNPGSAHEVGTVIDYRDGRFDPLEREFRGFGMVATEEVVADPAMPHRGVETFYHQSAALAGRVNVVWTFDASGPPDANWTKVIARTSNVWECADPATGGTIACPSQPSGNVWVRLKTVRDDTYSNFQINQRRVQLSTNETWHRCNGQFYGNVEHAWIGDASGAPQVHTHTEYLCRDDAASYMVDRAAHTVTRNSADAVALEEKWFFYDGAFGQLSWQGNPTAVESWVNVIDGVAASPCTQTPSQGGGGCVRTTMAYDKGNVVLVTDGRQQTTTTTYDDATQIYPLTVTDPLNHRVMTTYDPLCGTVLSRTIPYLASGTPPPDSTQQRYDSFCRLERVWRPGESTTGIPFRRYQYQLGSAGKPTVVLTIARELNALASSGVSSATLSDALGRMIEKKDEGDVDGNRTLLAAITKYDELGRVAQQSVPFAAGSPDLDASFRTYGDAAGTTGWVTFAYDALGRQTRRTNPDSSFRTMVHTTAWETTTYDECYNAPNCWGARTIDKRDAFGRTIESWTYGEDGLFKSAMRYDFDELGRLVATTQGTGSSWNGSTTVSSTYDSLGRKVQSIDPDSGRWTYRYDGNGNLVFQDDPAPNRHLEFCYDAGNRVTRKFVVSSDRYTALNCSTFTPGSTIAYDYNETNPRGLGRIQSVTDYAGSLIIDTYDVLGRVLKERRLLSVDQDTITAVMQYQYDAAGDHLWKITYPDGEVVSYTYDDVGRIASITGKEAYLLDMTYDEFGRPRRVTHANTVEDRLTYGTAATNYRLSQIESTQGSQTPTVLFRYAYVSYDANGRLMQLNDTSPSKGTGNVLDNTAALAYDAIGRLVTAAGPQLGSRTYDYDTLGNITVKDGMSLTYGGAPHQATTYGSTALRYDGNGNLTAKGSQTFGFDADDRLVDVDSGDVQFVYDYAGRRVIKKAATGEVTRYYNDLFEASSDDTVTKYYVAGSRVIASRHESNPHFASAAANDPIRIAARTIADPVAIVLVLRRDVQIGIAAGIVVLGAALIAPRRRRPRRSVRLPVRRQHAVGVSAALLATTLPWPIVLMPAPAEGVCGPTPIATHYHLDHLGSTQLVTDAAGKPLRHVRYTPYGEARRYDKAYHSTSGDTQFAHEFTGYETDVASGLHYAGARFYDPALGIFLTHDPRHQFASPYTYTNWNPTNTTDPNGEFIEELITAIIIAVTVSAALNTIIAAAQGMPLGQIGRAALTGAIAGAASVGLGVVLSGVSVGVAPIAGTLPAQVGADQALNALGEVAFRSAFAEVFANAASEVSSAAGAPDWASTLIAVGVGYGATVLYDQAILDASGDLAQIEAKGDFQRVSNTRTHQTITAKAATVAGYNEQETTVLVQNNLAQDLNVANNQTHFAAGAKKAFENFARQARRGNLPAAGAASHYIQDPHALGHILPGTDQLIGRWLAPLRGFIHQTIGGEVNFFRIAASGLRIPTSFDATVDFFEEVRPLVQTTTGL